MLFRVPSAKCRNITPSPATATSFQTTAIHQALLPFDSALSETMAALQHSQFGRRHIKGHRHLEQPYARAEV